MILGTFQDLMTMILGSVIILILCTILVMVHTQGKKVKDIEDQLKLTEKAREKTITEEKHG